MLVPSSALTSASRSTTSLSPATGSLRHSNSLRPLGQRDIHAGGSIGIQRHVDAFARILPHHIRIRILQVLDAVEGVDLVLPGRKVPRLESSIAGYGKIPYSR